MTSTRRSTGLWSSFESLHGRSEDGSQYSSVTDFKPDWKLYVTFGALCTLVFAVGLDTMILGTSLPTIASSFSATTTDAIWIAVSSNLTSTIFSLVFVAFSIIFGRKVMMLIAILFFIAGGITTSFATSTTLLIAGRTIQGVGSGAIVVLTEIFVTGLVPLRKRGVWFTTINLFWTLGAAGGPVVGAVLPHMVSWRWIFRVSPPFCIIPAVLVPFCLKFQIRKKISVREELARFDWFGLVIFAAAFTALLMAITLGGTIRPWSSWEIITLWSSGTVLGLAFVGFESFYARNPIVRLYLCNKSTTAITFLCAYLHGFILWSILFYLPLYYQAVKGFDSIHSGISILCVALPLVLMSLLTSVLISRTRRYKWFNFIGWAITTIGVSLFMLLDANTATPAWICLDVVVGIGLGVLFSGTAISTHATSRELSQSSSFAVTMLHFFRLLGGTTGIAACGTIFRMEMGKSLRSLNEQLPVLADRASQYTIEAIRLALTITNIPEKGDRDAIAQAYADGLKKVWLGLCILAVMGTVTCVFVKEYSLDGKPRDTQLSWIKVASSPSDTPHSSRRVSQQEEV